MQKDGRLKLVALVLLVLLTLSGCMPADASQRGVYMQVVDPSIFLVKDTPTDTQVPTHLAERAHVLQTLFATASLNQDVYYRYDDILIHWPEDVNVQGKLAIRIQTPSGRIYSERHLTAGASAQARLGSAYVFPEGDYHVVLMPMPGEYYVDDLRIERKIAVRIQSGSS